MKKSQNPFVGAWRITEMSEWTRDVIDMAGPATIQFGDNSWGKLWFMCVHGELHCRDDYDLDDADDDVDDDKPKVTFTWEGSDEMDEASGSGWAVLKTKNQLFGKIYFHGGDESTFTATRKRDSSTKKRSSKPGKRRVPSRKKVTRRRPKASS